MSFHQHLDKLGITPRAESVGVYFLAEGAAHQTLQARLEFHDASHCALWRLNVPAGLEKYAPLLFQAEAHGPLDDWLSEAANALALTVIHARMDLDALAQQLRRFSKFTDSNGRYFLRLGDPNALHLYVASLAERPDEVGRFFRHGFIDGFYFHAPREGLSRWVQPMFEQGSGSLGRDGCLVWRAPTAQEEA